MSRERPEKPTDEIALLLRNLDQAYDRRAWHGPNLRGSLRGVRAVEAAWRPGEGRHNVWELVVHSAYWKYAVTRRLAGLKRGSFALGGSNWLVRPEEATEKAWKADLEVLADCHQALRREVARLEPRQLAREVGKDGTKLVDLVLGVAAHDVYHAGQIQLLKRLYRSR